MDDAPDGLPWRPFLTAVIFGISQLVSRISRISYLAIFFVSRISFCHLPPVHCISSAYLKARYLVRISYLVSQNAHGIRTHVLKYEIRSACVPSFCISCMSMYFSEILLRYSRNTVRAEKKSLSGRKEDDSVW